MKQSQLFEAHRPQQGRTHGRLLHQGINNSSMWKMQGRMLLLVELDLLNRTVSIFQLYLGAASTVDGRLAIIARAAHEFAFHNEK